jgi:hypothetical protein
MTNVASLRTRAADHGSAAAVVGEAAGRAASLSLAALVERAGLQVRLDRKYLVEADDFARLAARLIGRLHVLEIDECRSFRYESHYFDTPDRLTYREHIAGRRDRFKLRTRSYLDSGETMFEVKLERPDGGTIKRRLAHPFAARTRITTDARRHVSRALDAAARRVPSELEPACEITYRRTTFVTRDGSARITCDHDLVWSDSRRAVTGLPDHVLVEVKSAQATTPADSALAALRVSPVSISKYCVGQALLRPELPSGPWDALLEHHFDRAQALAAA